MAALLQLLANGVLLGLIYAVVGLGLSVLLGILGIINVAHSAIIMLGAFFTLGLAEWIGVDPILSFALAFVVFFLFGTILFKLIIVRMKRAEQNQGLIAMFGLMVLIENVGTIFWTTNTRVLTVGYTNLQINLGAVSLPTVRVIAGFLALVLIGAFWFFLNRTLLGRAVRAMAQNPDAASAVGIDTHRLSLMVFSLGVAAAGAAGVIIAMMFPFAPQTQIEWLSWSFLTVILGGVGRVENTLLAGLLIGVTQTVATAFMPFDYVYLILYSALAIMLVARREGLRGALRRTI